MTTTVPLRELAPQLLKFNDLEEEHSAWRDLDDLPEAEGLIIADGLRFCCPVCYLARDGGHVHRVIVWQPRVTQVHPPQGARWELVGESFDALSLVGVASSVELEGGCGAHFMVTDGQVQVLP